MIDRLVAACVLAATAIAPTAASAQIVRSSSVPSYHLLQLTVASDAISAEDFEARTKTIRSCNDATAVARELGADVTRNRFVRATQMPEALQDVLEQVETGHASPIFSADPEVMRVLVICNRGQD